MKTAHDLVATAKSRVQEVALADAEQAIRNADVLVNVQSLAGGYDAWTAAGKPITKPETPSFE